MLGPNAVSRTLPQITLDRVWSVTPSLKILIIYHPPAIGRRVRRFDSSSDLPLARGVGAMGAAPPAHYTPTIHKPAMKINEDQCQPAIGGIGGIAGEDNWLARWERLAKNCQVGTPPTGPIK